MAAAILFASRIANAQSFDVVHAFAGGTDAALPVAGLIQATDGNFYGTSSGGGAHGFGTVFKMTPAGSMAILHSFNGGDTTTVTGDGGRPITELVQGIDGFFYGATSAIQRGFEYFTQNIFRISADGAKSIITRILSPSFEISSTSRVIQAPDGLYTTVIQTGLCQIWRLPQPTPFVFQLPIPGCSAGILGALTYAIDGRFYGTSSRGGAFDKGVVFRWSATSGFVMLHTFAGAEGANPRSLIQGTDGNFYGTTEAGGAFDQGTVFKMTPDGAVTVLHAFAGGTDGGAPSTQLLEATDGNFYGTAGGGAFNQGVVFKMLPSGDLTVLHAFMGGRTDGANPQSRLLQATDGNFYGTTTFGGTTNLGTAFKMTLSGAVTVLHSFGAAADGATPQAPLVQASDGSFYGTTAAGGALGQGIIFRVTPAGQASILRAFAGGSADGAAAVAGLIQGSDGNLYGTTPRGGGTAFGGGFGTVFKVTPAGVLTLLHAFTGGIIDGARPHASLVQAPDGSFLGTTAGGGSFGWGTIFRMTPDGTVTIVHAFGGTTEGAEPRAALIRATDGNYYGTTVSGGAFDRGTIFRLSSTGAVTVMYSFRGGVEGAFPQAGLVQASDGHLYGTASANGAFNAGTAFRLTLADALTVLHGFNGPRDGASPLAPLIQGTDGMLYGTTSRGGPFESGTIFRMTLGGHVTVLATPAAAEGAGLYAPLIQASDGNLYGTAAFGGAPGHGVVFRLALHAPPSSPSLVVVAPGNRRVRLSWAPVATAKSYTIKRSLGAGTEVVIASGLATPVYVDTAVVNGQTYHYVVSAVNASGESVHSYEVSMTAGRAPLGDFNGDGKTDITVFRPSTGVWYVRGISTMTWGGGGDLSVAADYDGDGKIDIAVFRPSSGVWYLRGIDTVTWGGEGDIPVVGDYDGDGKSDIAVFRPSTGVWYVRNIATVTWGGGGDIPVVGDYDGDGKADIAVFRPSTGVWYVRNIATVTWGGGGDIPVVGDYDGDGRSDIAVFRPSSGVWYIVRSSTTSATASTYGGSGDVPVPGDYDGDGRADIAVFRPSTGAWFIHGSSTLTETVVTWGISADIPIPKRP